MSTTTTTPPIFSSVRKLDLRRPELREAIPAAIEELGRGLLGTQLQLALDTVVERFRREEYDLTRVPAKRAIEFLQGGRWVAEDLDDRYIGERLAGAMWVVAIICEPRRYPFFIAKPIGDALEDLARDVEDEQIQKGLTSAIFGMRLDDLDRAHEAIGATLELVRTAEPDEHKRTDYRRLEGALWIVELMCATKPEGAIG